MIYMRKQVIFHENKVNCGGQVSDYGILKKNIFTYDGVVNDEN